MKDITSLTPEKLAEIRQRYTPIAAPKCHICGAEMTIGAMSACRIIYTCSGATYDDAGSHYAPGRSLADDHYAQSRVTVVDVSDPDVLALVEALESRTVTVKLPDGYVMAPAKANIEMIRAGGRAARQYLEEHGGNSPQVIYQAMLAAAPQAPAAGIQVIEGDNHG